MEVGEYLNVRRVRDAVGVLGVTVGEWLRWGRGTGQGTAVWSGFRCDFYMDVHLDESEDGSTGGKAGSQCPQWTGSVSRGSVAKGTQEEIVYDMM